mgnify:CR=1 FL=1
MKITSIEVILVDRPAVNPPFVWRKNIPGSDSGSYKVPRKIWYSHVIRTSLGGSTQYGNN